MKRFFIACGLCLCAAWPAAGGGQEGTNRTERDALADPFFMDNLKLFLEYDFYTMIELFRYYDVMKMAEERRNEK